TFLIYPKNQFLYLVFLNWLLNISFLVVIFITKKVFSGQTSTYKFLKQALFVSILGVSMNSCSLLKIETAQEPLSRQELNIRLLTQSLVQEATNRVEFAADSIILTTTSTDLQKHAFRWKIETLNTIKTKSNFLKYDT
ncbi:MAG TPA: hypothetical protein DCM10_09415, partial [Xanthomarina gelatinilytica]|nr:hypothetical protein [Xanthomarina gelatinilytica]